jgi:hypothetical protein
MEQAHRVKWVDGKREPQCPPNPNYPNGIDVDGSFGAARACTVALPYPAKRCGWYEVRCRACGLQVNVTTAGRVDDPRSVKVACVDQSKAN